MTILFKRILRTINTLKTQPSPNHLLGLFSMSCNQDKYHRFNGTAGRGGDAGEDAGGTRGVAKRTVL